MLGCRPLSPTSPNRSQQRSRVFALLFPLGMSLAVTASGADRAAEVVRRIDELYRAKSSRARVEMLIVTPDWQRTLLMEAWSEGMDKTFVRIEKPARERGVATLRIGSEMWNFLPKTNKVIKIPPSMMMSSWMGSDFTNDDLVREFSLVRDYDFEEIRPPAARPGLIYIRCVPKPEVPVVWGSVVLTVSEDYVPVRQEFFDEQGRVMRTLEYSEVKNFSGRRIPSVLEMRPAAKPGNRTIFRYLELELDVPVDPAVFTLRNLQTGG